MVRVRFLLNWRLENLPSGYPIARLSIIEIDRLLITVVWSTVRSLTDMLNACLYSSINSTLQTLALRKTNKTYLMYASHFSSLNTDTTWFGTLWKFCEVPSVNITDSKYTIILRLINDDNNFQNDESTSEG